MRTKQKIYRTKREVISDIIASTDVVLDVGFWGQAKRRDHADWVHGLLLDITPSVYGVDVVYDESTLPDKTHYKKSSAENFVFDEDFDIIFASDLIEHLSNPGLFLACCRKSLRDDGKLILTTPNAFNLYNITQKLLRREPPVNPDHTFYFNDVVLAQLLSKNGFTIERVAFIDNLNSHGLKRFLLLFLNAVLRSFTPKFLETLVIVAVPSKSTEE